MLLIGGGVLVASLASTYQKAHTARLDAELMEPALRLSRVLFNELGMPAAHTEAKQLKQFRDQTDSEIAAIRPKLEDLAARDSSGSTLPRTARNLLGELDNISNTRATIDSRIADDTLNTSSSLNELSSRNNNLFTYVQNLPDGLATDMAVTANSRSTISSATVFTNVTKMGFASANEIVVFSKTFSGQAKVNPASIRELEGLIAQQELGLVQAQRVATTEQNKQLTALSDTTVKMESWRSALEGSLGTGKTNFADPDDFGDLASKRLANIESVATDTARFTLKSAQDSETGALFRVAWWPAPCSSRSSS